MDYWKDGFVQDLALVIGLLALAAALRHLIKPLGRVGIPDCLIAGAMGMIAGPTGLGWLPFSTQLLEMVIYHLLAIVFIAVTLQTPPKGSASGSARSIAFAIPAVAVLQCFVGMLCVWGWNVAKGGPELHTGFAMLVPLGYNQGPGQAMSLGSAWERDAGSNTARSSASSSRPRACFGAACSASRSWRGAVTRAGIARSDRSTRRARLVVSSSVIESSRACPSSASSSR